MTVHATNSSSAAVPGDNDPGPGRRPTADRFLIAAPQLRDVIPVVLIVAVVMFTGVLLLRTNTTFSRIDELEHFNYVTSLVDHHAIPRKGDLYTPEAIRAQACWRYQIGAVRLPPCDSPTLDPHDFGNHGVTTAAGYPPVYYLATAAVAAPLKGLFGFDSLFIPARLASLLWLTLGSLASYLLARAVGAGRVIATAVALVAALFPMTLTQGTTVNPDAMSLLTGAGTALAWLRLRSVPRLSAAIGLTSVLAAVTLVKANFLAIPVAVTVAELALAARPRLIGLLRPSTWSPRRPLFRVTVAATTGALVGVIWSVLLIIRDRPEIPLGPSGAPAGTGAWNLGLTMRYAAASWAPLGGAQSLVHALDRGALVLGAQVVNLLIATGAVAAILLSRQRDVPARQTASGDDRAEEPARMVGYLAAASVAAAVPTLTLITGLSGAFLAYPARYSLFIVPLGLAALVGLAGARRSQLLVFLAVAVTLLDWYYLEALRWP
jgi:hypothetical protein